jgi:hypothetical protein
MNIESVTYWRVLIASQSAITRLPVRKPKCPCGLYFNVAPKTLSMYASRDAGQRNSSAGAQRLSWGDCSSRLLAEGDRASERCTIAQTSPTGVARKRAADGTAGRTNMGASYGHVLQARACQRIRVDCASHARSGELSSASSPGRLGDNFTRSPLRAAATVRATIRPGIRLARR